MAKRTAINEIKVTRYGQVNLELAFEIDADDGEVVTIGYHSVNVDPTGDMAQIGAAINAELVLRRRAPIPAAELNRARQAVVAFLTQAGIDAIRLAREQAPPQP